jgi:hypothetical protein
MQSAASARVAEFCTLAVPELNAASAIASTRLVLAAASNAIDIIAMAQTRSETTATCRLGQRLAHRLPHHAISRAGMYRPTVATATHAAEPVSWNANTAMPTL